MEFRVGLKKKKKKKKLHLCVYVCLISHFLFFFVVAIMQLLQIFQAVLPAPSSSSSFALPLDLLKICLEYLSDIIEIVEIFRVHPFLREAIRSRMTSSEMGWWLTIDDDPSLPAHNWNEEFQSIMETLQDHRVKIGQVALSLDQKDSIGTVVSLFKNTKVLSIMGGTVDDVEMKSKTLTELTTLTPHSYTAVSSSFEGLEMLESFRTNWIFLPVLTTTLKRLELMSASLPSWEFGPIFSRYTSLKELRITWEYKQDMNPFADALIASGLQNKLEIFALQPLVKPSFLFDMLGIRKVIFSELKSAKLAHSCPIIRMAEGKQLALLELDGTFPKSCWDDSKILDCDTIRWNRFNSGSCTTLCKIRRLVITNPGTLVRHLMLQTGATDIELFCRRGDIKTTPEDSVDAYLVNWTLHWGNEETDAEDLLKLVKPEEIKRGMVYIDYVVCLTFQDFHKLEGLKTGQFDLLLDTRGALKLFVKTKFTVPFKAGKVRLGVRRNDLDDRLLSQVRKKLNVVFPNTGKNIFICFVDKFKEWTEIPDDFSYAAV